MTTYKTPGVYIEEIVKFPPSVAQVETAIPAFIGYTEKAVKRNGDSLSLVPTRIESMLEYETLFGFAQAEDSIGVIVNDTLVNGSIDRSISVSQPSNRKPFLMYYSLQMYFANGGGPCYIVSVEQYEDPAITLISKGDLDAGLAAIRKQDEPTLLVFPDATNLGNTDDFYAVYNDALTQCNELQDRFTIIDTESDDEENGTPVADLRLKISNDKDYVKYGAAYYPFLETILDFRYDESSIIITHNSEDSQALADEITTAADARTAVDNLLTNSAALLANLTASDGIINDAAATVPDIDAEIPNQQSITTAIMADIDEVVTQGALVVAAAQAAATAAADDEDPDVIATAATNAANTLNTALTDPAGDLQVMKTALQGAIDDMVTAAAGGTKGDKQTASTNTSAAVATIATMIQAVLNLIDPAATDAIAAAQALDTNGILDGIALNTIPTIDNAAYNIIKAEINAMPMTLPPSSTMAGIYARVDSDRGVWKAPANVSLNYVVQPSLQISHEDQRDLNVDTVAGKSVNAIRAFVGKGNLVWGARTLAGNDNEWRYINVRRFFNMAEESIKKATEQFVFEPNDKNTWVRVKAMIDNFLTAQWRAGALAGPTPDKAFYVSVGLGETMTAQDILEGNMIIEIGMAAVRPAEFIILKFSHKMQEA